MSIYLSTGVFWQESLDEIIQYCLRHNLNNLELSSGIRYEPHLLRSVLASQDRMNFLVHNYFPPPEEPFVLNLASANSEILLKSIRLCKQAIDLSCELDAPFYSVHSGFAFHLTPEMLGDPLTQSTLHDSEHIPRQQAYEIFVDTVRDLASYGQTQGVTLLLENNVVSPLYLDGSKHNGLLMSDAEEISRCMDDVSDTNVGLLLDVGHLKVSANALNFPVDEFINRVGPYVGAIHLSENNGIVDNNQPLSETHWFLPLLHDFQQLPWIIEVYHLDSSGIKEQISILEHFLSG